MPNYLIKKDNKKKTIIYMEYDLNGYIFHPKKRSEAHIDIEKIVIVNPSLIDKILTIKFNKAFQKISNVILKIIEDDDTDNDAVLIALDEVSRLKSIILNKYQKFLTLEKEEQFLKKIRILENELQLKMISLVETEDKEYGRSR